MVYWILKGVEGRCGDLIWYNIPAVTWKYWRKSRNSPVRIVGLRVGIWKRDILPRSNGRCLLWWVVTNISVDGRLQVSWVKGWDQCCVCLPKFVWIWLVVMLTLCFGKRSNPVVSFFLVTLSKFKLGNKFDSIWFLRLSHTPMFVTVHKSRFRNLPVICPPAVWVQLFRSLRSTLRYIQTPSHISWKRKPCLLQSSAIKNTFDLDSMGRVLYFRVYLLVRTFRSCQIYVPDIASINSHWSPFRRCSLYKKLDLLKPTGHVTHQQFNIQQLYVLPTLYLCVLYLSENKQRHVPLTA